MKPAIFVAVLCLLVAVPTVAVAEIIISGEPIELPFSVSDQSCSMELFFKLTEGSTLPSLFGTSTYATLSPASAGVSITGVGKTVIHPYVFANSFGPGPWLPTEVSSINVADTIGGDVEPPPGNNAGLVKVDFSIAGGTKGHFDFEITIGPFETNVLDSDGNYVVLGAPISGSIDIVPEPGSLALLLSGTLAVARWFGGGRD